MRYSLYAIILQKIYPRFSYCMCCGKPWPCCKSGERSVKTSNYSGTFAVCNRCWDKSSPSELIQYYTEVYNHQQQCGEMDHTLEHLINCVKRDIGIDKIRDSKISSIIDN